MEKELKKITLACSIGLLCEGTYIILQLVMMRSFDAAIHLNFRNFLLWTAAEVGGYGLYLALAALGNVLEARAVQGKIILGAMASASNLTAGITNGLCTIAAEASAGLAARLYRRDPV